MPTTTALQGLTVPVGSDAPNGPSQITTLAQGVEKRLVQVYASGGARVSAFTAAAISPSAGMLSYTTGTKGFEVYDGASWVPPPGTIVSFHRRTSSKTYTGTEISVARLAPVSLFAGYRYKIMTSPLIIGTVSGETGKANLRYALGGGTASLSDAILGAVEANCNTAFRPVQAPSFAFTYVPGINIQISVLLTLTRSGGSGNVTLSGASDQPIEMWIEMAGPDTGDTVVDL